MNREPVVTTATVVALVGAVVALLVALGLPISDELKVALGAVVTAAAPIVTAVIARRKVTPVP